MTPLPLPLFFLFSLLFYYFHFISAIMMTDVNVKIICVIITTIIEIIEEEEL